MKKIAILTWLHNGNFGSVLQAVALQRYLTEQGNNSLRTGAGRPLACKVSETR